MFLKKECVMVRSGNLMKWELIPNVFFFQLPKRFKKTIIILNLFLRFEDGCTIMQIFSFEKLNLLVNFLLKQQHKPFTIIFKI